MQGLLSFSIFLILCILLVYTQKICLDDFESLNDSKCIRAFNISTWENVVTTHSFAVRQCGGYGAFPITIRNAIENNYIAQFALRSGLFSDGGNYVWLGLTCFGNDPSQCLWDDQSGNAGSWNQFAPGYPDIQNGACVQMKLLGNGAGQWINRPCSDSVAYICQAPPTLPDPSCDYIYNDYCYSISPQTDENLSIINAELDCQSRGSHLASIHSFAEYQYLRRAILNMPMVIGGRQIAEDQLAWMDGTPWDYSRIITSPYSSNYGCIYIRGWNQGDYDTYEPISCQSKTYRYFCKRPIGVTATPSPSNPPGCNGTTLTLIAPAVLTSPNYPNLYSNGLKCSYYIKCLDGKVMGIQFTDVQTEKDHDLITIRDGDEGGNILGTVSGETRNNMFYSQSNSLYVTFETDGQNVGFGFRAVIDMFAI